MRDLKSNRNRKIKPNRLRQKKQKRDWKVLFHRTLRVCVAAGSGFLILSMTLLTAQMLLESGYFGVQMVRVEHQSRVSEGDILEASDIAVGTSLFDLDLHLIGRKIEENPWIARADVERSFPDQVVIRVAERTPKAIVDLDYLYYVDGNGVVFKMLDGSDDLDFPIITGIEREELIEQQDEMEAEILKALALMSRLERRRVFNLEDVSEIHVDQDEGMIVYTRIGGVPIHLGNGGFDEKLQRLEKIYQDIEPRLIALEYIDLNVADRVIVKVDVKPAVDKS